MFRNRNQRLRFTPEQGDEVRVRCRVSLYEGRGEFQLIVEHMELAGEGALQAAFDKLKQKLAAEGLFDEQRKKPLPAAVSALGVVTSPSGAAIHDILTVLARRCPGIDVYILPVQVQGQGAAAQIAAAITLANRAASSGAVPLDALIVGRGGGSLEDLWAFNEEIVARAIAASALPVVSAVGHEVDFSIADFVADQRAPTPSAAAELLSPDQEESLQTLANMEYSLEQLMLVRLARLQAELGHLQRRLRHPGAQLRERAQRMDDIEQRLIRAQHQLLQRRGGDLRLLAGRLRANSPRPALARLDARSEELGRRLASALQHRLRKERDRVSRLEQLLHSLNPMNVLQRGYAILTTAEGSVLKSQAAAKPGQKLQATLADGELGLTVDSVEKGR